MAKLPADAHRVSQPSTTGNKSDNYSVNSIVIIASFSNRNEQEIEVKNNREFIQEGGLCRPIDTGVQWQTLRQAGGKKEGLETLAGRDTKTTKPGWLARLSFRGTGPISLDSTAGPECQFRAAYEPTTIELCSTVVSPRLLKSQFSPNLIPILRQSHRSRAALFTSPRRDSPVHVAKLVKHNPPSQHGRPHRGRP